MEMDLSSILTGHKSSQSTAVHPPDLWVAL